MVGVEGLSRCWWWKIIWLMLELINVKIIGLCIASFSLPLSLSLSLSLYIYIYTFHFTVKEGWTLDLRTKGNFIFFYSSQTFKYISVLSATSNACEKETEYRFLAKKRKTISDNIFIIIMKNNDNNTNEIKYFIVINVIVGLAISLS